MRAEAIRKRLNGVEFGEQLIALVKLGKQTFPAFEDLLANHETRPIHVMRILGVLRHINEDRSRFVTLAVNRLADPNPGVRCRAAELLEHIGSERDTGPLVALLSDADITVGYAAASALKAIGGLHDLIALNAWLNGTKPHVFQPEHERGYQVLREHVIKCRDELEERLEKAKQPKK